MSRPIWLTLCMAACGEPEDAACLSGFTLNPADGLCYEDESGPPTVDDVISSWEPCELAPGNGQLDVEAGCAAGACSGDTYVEMVAALGAEADCQESFFGDLSCLWSVGIYAYFPDMDGDGVPDAGETAFGVHTELPFDGTTESGLGLGIPLECWVTNLSPPDELQINYLGNSWAVHEASWYDPYLYVTSAEVQALGVANVSLYGTFR